MQVSCSRIRFFCDRHACNKSRCTHRVDCCSFIARIRSLATRAGGEAAMEWDDVKPGPAAAKAEPAATAANGNMPDPFAASGDEAAGDDDFAWEDV